MTPREEILQQALALPPQGRAFVAAALEESLSAAGDEDLATCSQAPAWEHSVFQAPAWRVEVAYKTREQRLP